MRNVKWTDISERVEHSRNIPAAYHRLVCQLTAEIAHAPKQSDHEAIRRCVYATEVLDAFAMELYSVRSPTPDFRSKVLTPILQRQLRGLPDFYYPPIVTAIASNKKTVTLSDATTWYLQEDPTLPEWIPSYRRTLIYIPDMLWHLGVVLGKIELGDKAAYRRVRKHHDIVVTSIKRKVASEGCFTLTRGFTIMELNVIVEEGLDDYFAPELEHSVRAITTSSSSY